MVFWLLASASFSADQPSSENLKGALVIAVAMVLVDGLHRLTCWVVGGRVADGAR